MEKIKKQYPDQQLLLTFFSPSGYEIRKDYKGANWVFYLPIDTKANARKFFDIVDPGLVVFTKYDYWYYYLTECRKRKIPLLMISAIFRKKQPFFQWYGSLHRKMLKCFTHFFVQDENSKELLQTRQINAVTVAGDTRFDRVAEIAENFTPIEAIEKFCGQLPVLVAGSTWPADEKLIRKAVAFFPELKLIIAPHEIYQEHIDQLKSIFPNAVLYSQLTTRHSPANPLIIDNIGMLARLYRYATITYIGGGFDKGIHNTLEAAVYGKPVLFGPNYKKFKEAIGLTEAGGGIPVSSSDEFMAHLKNMLSDRKHLKDVSKNSFDFVNQNKGATEKIMQFIQENRLLTS